MNTALYPTGKELRELRESRGIDRKSLAVRCAVTTNALRGIESSRRVSVVERAIVVSEIISTPAKRVHVVEGNAVLCRRFMEALTRAMRGFSTTVAKLAKETGIPRAVIYDATVGRGCKREHALALVEWLGLSRGLIRKDPPCNK